jgi:serine/threonine protein kinase
VWKQLKHPYILPFIGVDCVTFQDHPSLVSPWMSCGTLLDYAREKKDDVCEHLRLVSSCAPVLPYASSDFNRQLTETAEGLHYLHDFGAVHGDLKAVSRYSSDLTCPCSSVQANVFVSSDQHPLLADFGLAGLGDTMTAIAATTSSEDRSIRWSAPELHDPELFGFKDFRRTRAADVYAFGCLGLEVSACFICRNSD